MNKSSRLHVSTLSGESRALEYSYLMPLITRKKAPMPENTSYHLSPLRLFLILLFFLVSFPPVLIGGPEQFEGRYLVQRAGETRETGMQIYFRGGVLRTLDDGNNFVRTWEESGENPSRFTRSTASGSFRLIFRESSGNAPVEFEILDGANKLVMNGIRKG